MDEEVGPPVESQDTWQTDGSVDHSSSWLRPWSWLFRRRRRKRNGSGEADPSETPPPGRVSLASINESISQIDSITDLGESVCCHGFTLSLPQLRIQWLTLRVFQYIEFITKLHLTRQTMFNILGVESTLRTRPVGLRVRLTNHTD